MERGGKDRFVLSGAVSPASQLRALRTLLIHVRRARGAGLVPMIEVDLDLAALMPVHRTQAALAKTGRYFGITEFERAEHLPTLPAYTDEGWFAFITLLDLPRKYPGLTWLGPDGKPTRAVEGPFSVFHDAYWDVGMMAEDVPTPGLGSFRQRVQEVGGDLVFVSGRWLEAHVGPSRTALERAGIVEPRLVIGNPAHPTLVGEAKAMSDAEVKAAHQEQVRGRHGTPVAVIDDRLANRRAVVNAGTPGVLSVAIAVPGFTYDAAMNDEALRLSTFETFDNVLDDEPRRPFMVDRYGGSRATHPWRGTYEGFGANQRPYVLPRRIDEEPMAGRACPYAELLRSRAPRSLTETELLEACVSTIPAAENERLLATLTVAEKMAADGFAAPFPAGTEERARLRLGLIASWLHSRDVEELMTAVGYPIAATGVHDLVEHVFAIDIRRFIALRGDGRYSSWLVKWIDTLAPDAQVNVGCLNPALLVSMWNWTPGATLQDAMDVHRVASHHEGDGRERFDPVEATINNLLHQREGIFGIRKEPIRAWSDLRQTLAMPTGAECLVKNSVGRDLAIDALMAAERLERGGCLTPWCLVRP